MGRVGATRYEGGTFQWRAVLGYLWLTDIERVGNPVNPQLGVVSIQACFFL
jgi:hypothetical protein